MAEPDKKEDDGSVYIPGWAVKLFELSVPFVLAMIATYFKVEGLQSGVEALTSDVRDLKIDLARVSNECAKNTGSIEAMQSHRLQASKNSAPPDPDHAMPASPWTDRKF